MRTLDRLLALMDHLGLKAAHVATQMPSDIADLASEHPERIAGAVLCVPTRLDPAPFSAIARRLLMIAGDTGLTAETTERAIARLEGARRVVLAGYAAAGWSDVVADRTGDVAGEMTTFLRSVGDADGQVMATAGPLHGTGTHAGITYRIEGQGPPLLLLPFFLAPSQWAPARAELSRSFTVIELGGPHIGGVAALEDRAKAPTYRAMFHTLVDLLGPEPGHRILDVGCGSGALDRMLARQIGSGAHIDAVDLNPFFLKEAAMLAADVGVGSQIRFGQGSALSLPFAERTFDRVFSVTVLEECDADRAIAEMVRVTKPGGRIGIVVRAIDLPQWWNLPLPPGLQAKTAIPPQSVGQGGVADASLYARMRRAGLIDLVPFPSLITLDRTDGPIWRYREDHILSLLRPDEAEVWRTARASALAEGVLMQSHALHCAVATKPG